MKNRTDSELVSNRKAFHEYEISETLEAGIVLSGTEVKSLRNHGGSLQDAYVLISKGKTILKNASISPYSFGNIRNHEEKRERLLLLHKREILRLEQASERKGMTIIPLALYIKNGFIKVKIGVAKGKNTYDKRQSVKEKEHKRSMDRALKSESSD